MKPGHTKILAGLHLADRNDGCPAYSEGVYRPLLYYGHQGGRGSWAPQASRKLGFFQHVDF